MQVVRELKKIQGKQITIDLPDNFYAKEVEIIVIPYKRVLPVDNSNDWKKDFLSVSQWDIREDEVKLTSWPIEEC
ncbi:MAG: hypothetical protein GY801_29870 [bacterium]|nr:hypothetical protein [bacterium]